MTDPGMCEVKTADLIGSELDWAIEVHLGIDKPKTFACHHYGPTCRACHDMVLRWRDSNRPKLGDITSVPKRSPL